MKKGSKGKTLAIISEQDLKRDELTKTPIKVFNRRKHLSFDKPLNKEFNELLINKKNNENENRVNYLTYDRNIRSIKLNSDLLIDWNVRLSPIHRSQSKTALLEFRFGVIPILVHNEVFQTREEANLTE